MKTGLQHMTWDQAAISGLASANGFGALDIKPANIRWWASEGLLHPAGIGPRGNMLYQISAVIAVAQRDRKKPPGRPAKSHPCNSPGNSQQ